jgi:hypothetical protein
VVVKRDLLVSRENIVRESSGKAITPKRDEFSGEYRILHTEEVTDYIDRTVNLGG